MGPREIRAFRDKYDLSREELAQLLETDSSTVKKLESHPSTRQHRPLATRMRKVLLAYDAGIRF